MLGSLEAVAGPEGEAHEVQVVRSESRIELRRLSERGLLLYENEIRSVEGPDAAGAAPKEPPPVSYIIKMLPT